MIQALSSHPQPLQRPAAISVARFGRSTENYPPIFWEKETPVQTGFFRNLFNWFFNLIAQLFPENSSKPDISGPALDLIT